MVVGATDVLGCKQCIWIRQVVAILLYTRAVWDMGMERHLGIEDALIEVFNPSKQMSRWGWQVQQGLISSGIANGRLQPMPQSTHTQTPLQCRTSWTCSLHRLWPKLAALESVGTAVAAAMTLQSWWGFFWVMTRGGWMSLLNRRGRWWPQYSRISSRGEQTKINQWSEHQRLC